MPGVPTLRPRLYTSICEHDYDALEPFSPPSGSKDAPVRWQSAERDGFSGRFTQRLRRGSVFGYVIFVKKQQLIAVLGTN